MASTQKKATQQCKLWFWEKDIHANLMKRPFCVLLPVITVFSPLVLLAKRGAPSPVPPIARNGIVYSAPNDNGTTGYVVASDSKGGRKLWEIVVFETKIDANLEEDVQWVFITRLKFAGDSLMVQDERARCYRLNLTTRTVEKVVCNRIVLIWFLLVLVIALVSWLAIQARAGRHGSPQTQR